MRRVALAAVPPTREAAPEQSVVVREGSIIEIDRSHLAVGRKLGEAKKFAAKVTRVTPDPDHPGYAYVFAYSSKLQSEVMLAIPPKGAKWVGPKIRVIR